jgi:methyltransferase family protein
VQPRPDLRFDPYVNDIGRLGVALTNFAEILIPCLEAAGARSVAEVGAYAGDLTGLLLDWGERSGAKVIAVDPEPQRELEMLHERRPELELLGETSLEALRRIDLPDAVIVDGDHNYYTVSEELRLIAERAGDRALPLLVLHDVGWPHGRRDDYFDPELVPEDRRQPIAPDGGLHPDEPGIDPEGMPYRWPAAREGGARNGVLTAVEDFVSERSHVRLAVVPAFFGFAVVWPEDAPWADRVAHVVEHVDRNPFLERLERNRIRHLATHRHLAIELTKERERGERKDELLRRLAGSRTFALAGLLSRIRGRGKSTLTDDELRRALG